MEIISRMTRSHTHGTIPPKHGGAKMGFSESNAERARRRRSAIARRWVENIETFEGDWSTQKIKQYSQIFFKDEQKFIDWT